MEGDQIPGKRRCRGNYRMPQKWWSERGRGKEGSERASEKERERKKEKGAERERDTERVRQTEEFTSGAYLFLNTRILKSSRCPRLSLLNIWNWNSRLEGDIVSSAISRWTSRKLKVQNKCGNLKKVGYNLLQTILKG